MNINDILSQNQAGENSLVPDLSASISDFLAPFMWLSAILAVVFIGLYLYSMTRRRRLENALFDIQKNIAEINARDKARTTPPSSSPIPRPATTNGAIIAQADTVRREP